MNVPPSTLEKTVRSAAPAGPLPVAAGENLPGTWTGQRPRQAEYKVDLRALLREVGTGWRAPGTWTRTSLLRLLGVFCVAGVCSWLGIVLSRQSEGVATIWLSNGIVFGLLVTQPPRRWLPYFVAGLVADTLADMVYGDPFRVAIGVSAANCVEVVTSSILLTWQFGFPLDLWKRRSLVGFLLIAVVGAAGLASLLGAAWTKLFYEVGPFFGMLRTWWLGDMLGMALFAPLVISVQRPAFFAIFKRQRLPHTLLVLAGSAVVSVLVFTHNSDPLIFFMFPAMLLVAFRLRFPGTVLNIFLMTLIAIGMTIKGHGPLMLIVGPHMLLHRIIVAQIFGAVAIFTMFPVAALLEEREGLEASLAANEAGYKALAHADELTGLANRRAFNLRFAADWQQAQARRSSLALLLIDADLFKQYNDLFGHLGGDECLRSLANVIGERMRGVPGLVARYGGEEFAVLLPDTDQRQAKGIAESIRMAVATRAWPHPSSPFQVQTVSVGVAAMVPEEGQASTQLVMLADQALYSAKVLGRNQVVVA